MRPGSEPHVTLLRVEWEVRDVDGTTASVDRVRIPHDGSVIWDDGQGVTKWLVHFRSGIQTKSRTLIVYYYYFKNKDLPHSSVNLKSPIYRRFIILNPNRFEVILKSGRMSMRNIEWGQTQTETVITSLTSQCIGSLINSGQIVPTLTDDKNIWYRKL